ncbi:hypothetical protein RSSM_02795 [Rhodopirellula sallentina SM41]|uniref:Uncharacterized protein n=1 Tax=Rhodopirellula sallentina SM41 TaxID=1263870 RepID=M5U3F0_9BACT|nr:hypothetical protein RSSM_02795 [Rhodopirellula sallentina SM41]
MTLANQGPSRQQVFRINDRVLFSASLEKGASNVPNSLATGKAS